MTKKLLPAMIGAALVGGMTAASADVTVFGHLDAAITNFDKQLAVTARLRLARMTLISVHHLLHRLQGQ